YPAKPGGGDANRPVAQRVISVGLWDLDPIQPFHLRLRDTQFQYPLLWHSIDSDRNDIDTAGAADPGLQLHFLPPEFALLFCRHACLFRDADRDRAAVEVEGELAELHLFDLPLDQNSDWHLGRTLDHTYIELLGHGDGVDVPDDGVLDRRACRLPRAIG